MRKESVPRQTGCTALKRQYCPERKSGSLVRPTIVMQ